MHNTTTVKTQLLTPAHIRELCTQLNIAPTKTLGQNFVHDAHTVRKIVREAKVQPGEQILEIGPGLGSLTLGLLEAGAYVSAVELDNKLAEQLNTTVANRCEKPGNLAVIHEDALNIQSGAQLAIPANLDVKQFIPTKLVANLPYNVAVPIILTLLNNIPSIEHITVMVQMEVAERLSARPGSKIYGVPSLKTAWYGETSRGAKIARTIFWPEPRVDSALVHLDRYDASKAADLHHAVDKTLVFELVDTAFAQRRKTLRAALSKWAGSGDNAEKILIEAGVSPQERGEKLGIKEFISIARAAQNNLNIQTK